MIVFIEPGPGITQYFNAVAEHIGKERTAFYSTNPKSRSKLKKLGARTYPSSLNKVQTGISIPDYSKFEKLVLNPKNIADSYSREILKNDIYNHYHKLSALFQSIKPDAIFLWNGSGLTSSIAIYLAHLFNIKTIYGENGYFPLTMQIDPEGVNALSSITGKFNLDDFQKFNYTHGQYEVFDNLIRKIRDGKKFLPTPANKKVDASLFSKLRQDLKSLNLHKLIKQRATSNKHVPDDAETLPDRYVFFPLQVRNDSQLTNHSPLFGNDTYSMIDAVSKAVERSLPNSKLIIKLHPADISKTDYDPLISKYKNIIWIKNGDIQRLLKNSEIVVTVNSTTGFEALFYYKPVILLGHNFYNIPGLTHSINDKSQLSQLLQLCISSKPEPEKINAALMYYYFNFFTQGHCRDFSHTSIFNVATKIVSMSQ